jgi:hypothetical protein
MTSRGMMSMQNQLLEDMNQTVTQSQIAKNSQDEETIGSLQGMTKRIFSKIKDQLEDKSHPLIQVISWFREEFCKDVMR